MLGLMCRDRSVQDFALATTGRYTLVCKTTVLATVLQKDLDPMVPAVVSSSHLVSSPQRWSAAVMLMMVMVMVVVMAIVMVMPMITTMILLLLLLPLLLLMTPISRVQRVHPSLPRGTLVARARQW